jgi:hypothetical protein
MIEFVSYDGKFPTPCLGSLMYLYNGVKHTVNNPLKSGGACFIDPVDGKEVLTTGKWRLRMSMFPHLGKAEFMELEKLVNDNVTAGCCGGCLGKAG